MNVFDLSNVSIIIITHDLELAEPVKLSLLPFSSEVFYAPKYPSFSKVVNEAICKATNDTVIICSYKVRPKPQDVIRLISLLNDGFGFVGLYRFAFFGFKKDLVNRIGFFDERFVGGGYEDCDYLRRIVEANIACYDDESVEYIHVPSTWDYTLSKIFFEQKWKHDDNTIKRMVPEEKYEYKLNCKNTNISYKDRTYSCSSYPWSQNFCRKIQFL